MSWARAQGYSSKRTLSTHLAQHHAQQVGAQADETALAVCSYSCGKSVPTASHSRAWARGEKQQARQRQTGQPERALHA